MTDVAQLELNLRKAIDDGSYEDILIAEWTLDAGLHIPKTTLLAAALWYAEQNLPVFPVQKHSKQPLTTHGVKDATTDTTQILEWWTKNPEANIGAAMGVTVDLIDIDGLQGHRSLRDHPEILEDFDILARVWTPRPAGQHVYIPATGAGNSGAGGMLPGVDYKGRGGYALLPPSYTLLPDYRGHYRFVYPPRFA